MIRVLCLSLLVFLFSIGFSTNLAAQLQIDSIVSTMETCPGACDGGIDIYASNGIPPYQYDIGGGGFSTSSFTGLCAGTYNISVTDASPTTVFGLDSVTSPFICPGVNFSINTTNCSINGTCDGTAEVIPSNGTPPYTTVWYDASMVPIPNEDSTYIDSLCAGSYYVSVSDACVSDPNSCPPSPPTLVPFTISEPPVLVLTLNYTIEPTCAFFCDGLIDVSASGGVTPYMYEILGWTGPQSSGFFFGMCGNMNYDVQVTDANGAVTIINVFLFDPPPIDYTYTFTNASCNGSCDGTIDFNNVTGGFPPYQYSINNGTTIQTSNTFTGLCAGTYGLMVMDANGCTDFWGYQVTISEPTALTNTASVVSQPSAPGVCDGSLTASATGGTSPYAYEWYDCSGTNLFYTTPTITGQCAGNYYSIVYDANGCIAQSTCVTLVDPPCNLTTTISNTGTVQCFGDCDGSAFFSTTGGTPPYVYVDQATGDTVNGGMVNGMCAGIYTYTVSDALGCSETFPVFISENPELIATATLVSQPTAVGACNGEIQIGVSGGTVPYTVELYDCVLDTVFGGIIIGFPFEQLCEGTYGAIITDANGCKDTTNCIDIVDPPDGIFENSASFTFQLYPNPANVVLVLSYETLSAAPLEIVLMNALGQQVASQNVAWTKGENSVQFETQNLADGIYFIRMQHGGRIYTERVVIAH